MSCTAHQHVPSSPSSFPRVGTLSSCRKSPGHPVQNHWFADAHRGAGRVVHGRPAPWDVRHDRELRCAWLYALYGVEGYAAEYPGALRSAVYRGDYRLLVRDDKGGQLSQGTVTLRGEYPTFRTFFLVGEAFFLPGFDGQGQPPRLTLPEPA